MKRLRQEIGIASNRIRRLERELAIFKTSKKRLRTGRTTSDHIYITFSLGGSLHALDCVAWRKRLSGGRRTLNVSVRCSEFAAYKRVSGSKRNAMVMDECINFFFFCNIHHHHHHSYKVANIVKSEAGPKETIGKVSF